MPGRIHKAETLEHRGVFCWTSVAILGLTLLLGACAPCTSRNCAQTAPLIVPSGAGHAGPLAMPDWRSTTNTMARAGQAPDATP